MRRLRERAALRSVEVGAQQRRLGGHRVTEYRHDQQEHRREGHEVQHDLDKRNAQDQMSTSMIRRIQRNAVTSSVTMNTSTMRPDCSVKSRRTFSGSMP